MLLDVKVTCRKNEQNSSTAFDSISPTSGDSGRNDSDLVHYCAEFVTLGLRVLGASG